MLLFSTFAVADIKYNILGTHFFEDNLQNINVQDFTRTEFNYQSKIHHNYAKVTTLLSKDYPYFSYNYRITSKTQRRLKPKSSSSKIARLPIKKSYNLHFTTTPKNYFFPTIPHTYFATKFHTNFNFIEVFTDKKPNICATIFSENLQTCCNIIYGTYWLY